MNNVKRVLRKLGTKAKDLFMNIKKKKAKLFAQIATYFISAYSLAVSAFATGQGGSGGGAMFGLAIKNDDADAKTRGLMTLAAGFVVFAVTQALDMFMV